MGPWAANEVRASSGMDSVCATAVPSTRNVRPDALDSATNAASMARRAERAVGRQLRRGVLAADAAPAADEHDQRDEHELPRREEDHQIERHERGDDARREQRQRGRGIASVRRSARATTSDTSHSPAASGTRTHAHAVDAEVPLGADRPYPHVPLDELEAVVAVARAPASGHEARVDPQREAELRHRDADGHAADERLVARPATRAATAAISTTSSGSSTSSDSACAPSQPSPVGSCARKPIATSPASSSVDVTMTCPKACRDARVPVGHPGDDDVLRGAGQQRRARGRAVGEADAEVRRASARRRRRRGSTTRDTRAARRRCWSRSACRPSRPRRARAASGPRAPPGSVTRMRPRRARLGARRARPRATPRARAARSSSGRASRRTRQPPGHSAWRSAATPAARRRPRRCAQAPADHRLDRVRGAKHAVGDAIGRRRDHAARRRAAAIHAAMRAAPATASADRADDPSLHVRQQRAQRARARARGASLRPRPRAPGRRANGPARRAQVQRRHCRRRPRPWRSAPRRAAQAERDAREPRRGAAVGEHQPALHAPRAPARATSRRARSPRPTQATTTPVCSAEGNRKLGAQQQVRPEHRAGRARPRRQPAPGRRQRDAASPRARPSRRARAGTPRPRRDTLAGATRASTLAPHRGLAPPVAQRERVADARAATASVRGARARRPSPSATPELRLALDLDAVDRARRAARPRAACARRAPAPTATSPRRGRRRAPGGAVIERVDLAGATVDARGDDRRVRLRCVPVVVPAAAETPEEQRGAERQRRRPPRRPTTPPRAPCARRPIRRATRSGDARERPAGRDGREPVAEEREQCAQQRQLQPHPARPRPLERRAPSR